MKNFLKLLTLLMMVMFVSAAPAAAAEDDYYYPGYDPAVEGYVDLMQYMTGITITAGGKKYTKEALQELKDKGTPLEVDLGDTVTFNFDFSLCGRRYDDDDPTLFSEAKSVKTVYTHDTRYLNGTEISAGSTAVLDDSSLMLGTSLETTCLRMDIAWMLELCPQNFSIYLHRARPKSSASGADVRRWPRARHGEWEPWWASLLRDRRDAPSSATASANVPCLGAPSQCTTRGSN